MKLLNRLYCKTVIAEQINIASSMDGGELTATGLTNVKLKKTLDNYQRSSVSKKTLENETKIGNL